MVEEMRSTGWEHEHGCEANEKESVVSRRVVLGISGGREV